MDQQITQYIARRDRLRKEAVTEAFERIGAGMREGGDQEVLDRLLTKSRREEG